MTIIYHKTYDKVRKEYGNIVTECVLPKDTNAEVNEVWNFFTKKLYLKVLWEKQWQKNRGCFQKKKIKCLK